MRRTAALIVGGGPAGSAAAIDLARAGIEAELIERTDGPHDTVCGGFLGWDSLAALDRLGIDPAALGARPIRRLRLVSAERSIEMPLPRPAAGLSRRALDEALLAAAQRAGAAIRRGRTVRAADLAERRVRLDDEEALSGEALILATGKHELRGAARPVDISTRPLGLRSALEAGPALAEALEGVIELHLYDGGYAGLLMQEDGRANFCLSASRDRLKEAGGIAPLVARLAEELPAFGERLGQGVAGGWSAVSGVPYGWRSRETVEGVYRVGDQSAVIASLAGDGIAIALESGAAAARAIADGKGAQDFQRDWARRARRPIGLAEVLRRSAENRMARQAMMGLLGWLPSLAPLAARLTRIGSG
ncbi:MAG TPA: FAD-dependent monooxygenase [Allosphingosinicella sp.]|nr:FAD-dependent monooxygenase [Allosphingosinicella sp.]